MSEQKNLAQKIKASVAATSYEERTKRKQTSLMAAFAKTKDLDEAAKKRLRHRRAKMSAAK